jgi:integrase
LPPRRSSRLGHIEREIAEVLGHKTLQMSMKYTHLTLPHTVGVLDRMAQRFPLARPEAAE